MVYTVGHSICIFWYHLIFYGKATLFKFWGDNGKFFGLRIFTNFTIPKNKDSGFTYSRRDTIESKFVSTKEIAHSVNTMKKWNMEWKSIPHPPCPNVPCVLQQFSNINGCVGGSNFFNIPKSLKSEFVFQVPSKFLVKFILVIFWY